MKMLSTNILNWIKYQNENRKPVKEKILFYDLVNQVFSILNSLAKQKNISLVNNIDQSMIIHQYAEPLKILVYNLLSNAINFSEQGSITVTCKTDFDKWKISVEDHGSGMSPDQIQNLLSEHITITAASIDRRKGHGLGFLIIKDLLKMMEGTLKIQSEKNKGTIVTISFSKEV